MNNDWKRNPKDRPGWDTYFMTLAFVVSQRSLDPHTAHGCVIVNKYNQILSMGYNSPPPGCIDDLIPLNRPDKYPFMVHAEENAILNANSSLEESSVYVTGMTCVSCFAKLRAKRVSRIIYGPVGSNMIKDEDMERINLMNFKDSGNDRFRKNHIEIIEYKEKNRIPELLNITCSYYRDRQKLSGNL